jgi:predicted nucleotidyltransferase
MSLSSLPTPYPEINALLAVLLENIQAVLGAELTGLYLDGSLANGGFDADSDIDFAAVTAHEMTEERFAALRAMHERIAALDTPWAIQIEGSYLSQAAVRRYDPALVRYPNIERGPDERLKMVEHGPWWAVHRYILRKCGIRLVGPSLATLIDPVPPEELRAAMRNTLQGWSNNLLAHPEIYPRRGYQSYIVLSHCRILYTLATGDVVSKQAAAAWVKESYAPEWGELIERAWEGRHTPDQPASNQDILGTRDFIRFVLTKVQLN